jgi:predicted enzyme related to lactoylglutathione lyase
LSFALRLPTRLSQCSFCTIINVQGAQVNDNPAAKAYQQAIFQQDQPAVMFFTADIKGDYDRIKARGAKFAMPPTEVTGSTIAKLNDTCGNLIQITQLARW